MSSLRIAKLSLGEHYGYRLGVVGENMTWESAVSFFFAVLVFGVTPGPGVFAVMARALVSGSFSCWFLALGMTISDILYLIAACIGLAALATHWGEVFTIVRIVGAIYLVYLGWKMWHAPLDLKAGENRSAHSGMALSFFTGFPDLCIKPQGHTFLYCVFTQLYGSQHTFCHRHRTGGDIDAGSPNARVNGYCRVCGEGTCIFQIRAFGKAAQQKCRFHYDCRRCIPVFAARLNKVYWRLAALMAVLFQEETLTRS